MEKSAYRMSIAPGQHVGLEHLNTMVTNNSKNDLNDTGHLDNTNLSVIADDDYSLEDGNNNIDPSDRRNTNNTTSKNAPQ
mmetsp:Transcript_27414/g.26274  ORF Transcript_27414/g.26274 Transcript_27414/m.26274 type:complete len:80 (-) Transcript_27414:242-481(-)